MLQFFFEILVLVNRLGGQRPLHHFAVRGRGQVDPSRGFQHVQRFGKMDQFDPRAVFLQRAEKLLDPAVFVAVLVRTRPDSELLAVVGKNHQRRTVLFGPAGQKVQCFLNRTERNGVAQPLGDGENVDRESRLFCEKIAVQLLFAQPRVFEVGVVDHHVLHTGLAQWSGQVRLPHTFRQPQSARRHAEVRPDVVGQFADLSQLVAVRNNGKNRLVEAPGHHLDLPSFHESTQPIEKVGMVSLDPLQQDPGVVLCYTDPRVLFESFQEGQVSSLVGILENEVEIPHGLVIVNADGKVNGAHVRSFRQKFRASRRKGFQEGTKIGISTGVINSFLARLRQEKENPPAALCPASPQPTPCWVSTGAKISS